MASNGDVFLGGSDFDNVIAMWMVDCFKNDNGVNLKDDIQAFSRIIEASEKAKIELSSCTSTEINLPYITLKDNTPLHLQYNLTRAKFEQMSKHLVERIIECAKKALKEADVEANELDSILLVGGQSRSLAIQEALSDNFGVRLEKSLNPDESVAVGAAIQANNIVGGEGSNEVLLLDVTPLTLGIETMGGVMTPIVESNTTIPCKREQVFSTVVDNQPSVLIHVLQGERPLAKDNKSLGTFILDGIMPSKRGVPQINVIFDIDVNGIVSVSAVDKATGKEHHITIENKNNLSDEEIERIKEEAKQYEAEDKKTKERLEKSNRCESLIYQTENTMESFKDNPSLTEDDKNFFNEKIGRLNEMKEKQDFTEFDSVANEINARWNTISTKAYGHGSNGNSDNVINDLFGNKFGNFGGFNPNTGGGNCNNCGNNDCDVQDAQ